MIEKKKHKMLVVSIYRLFYSPYFFKRPCPSGRNILDAREREFSSHGFFI